MERNLNIEYIIQLWQEGGTFIAHAMPLDVMSAGNTPEEARKALDEAVQLFLLTAADTGALQEILEECGCRERAIAYSPARSRCPSGAI